MLIISHYYANVYFMSPKKNLKNNELTYDQYVGDVSYSPGFINGVLSNIDAIIHARRLQQENSRLRYESSHDDLTGLLNKKAWRGMVEKRIEEKRRFGVAFIDLDAFKAINDKLGHEKGDEILGKFGEHMIANFNRQEDAVTHERLISNQGKGKLPVGRLGGDEFGIIVDLDRVQDETSPEQRMERALGYAQDVVKQFVDLQDEEVSSLGFGVSLGGAIWQPDNPITATELIKQADQAMYADKTARRGDLAR